MITLGILTYLVVLCVLIFVYYKWFSSKDEDDNFFAMILIIPWPVTLPLMILGGVFVVLPIVGLVTLNEKLTKHYHYNQYK